MRASSLIRDVTIKVETVGVTEAAATADKLGTAVDGAAAANDSFSRSTLSVDKALDRMRRQIDESYRQSKQFEAGQRTLDRALEASRITTDEYNRDLALLAQRFGTVGSAGGSLSSAADDAAAKLSKAAVANDKFRHANDNAAKSAALARHELINLSRQVQDVATMFAMGAPPMQIFASQASQIFDIFSSSQGTVRGFLSQLGGGISRLVTSGAGLAAGATALAGGAAYSAYSYAESQRAVESALRGVGAASGATQSGINRLALAEAAAARVSVASAREIAAAYAGTGKVNAERLPGLVGFTREYSAFTGMGTGDAAQELTKAFADPSKGAEGLTEKLGGLNSAALRWIQSQQAAGNLLGAQRALLEAFQQQVQGSTERVGLFARSWDLLKRSVSDADDALGRALNGPTDAERLSALLKQRESLRVSQAGGALGASNQLRILEAQIRPLEAIVELERQRQAIDERTTKAANAGLAASAISDQIEPIRKQMEELVALQTKLEEARRLNKGAPEYDEWGKALDRVKGAIATLLPASERERQSHELTIRSIAARTLTERTAIEVARETLRLSGEKVSATEREAAAQRKAAEVQAQANRDAQDAVRASRDQLALSGLRGPERFAVEQEQRRRDLTERFGGASVSLPQTAAAAQGLDAAFAEAIRKFMAAVPGLGVTSGFRTYEEQARLYREKPGWAARPGTSNHERGIAADLNYYGSGQLPAWVREKGAEFGLHFPLQNRAVRPEPWHVEPIGGRGAATGTGGSAVNQVLGDYATARERDMRLSVIGGSEDELKRQAAALEIQRQAFGKSTEELARQNAQQDLFNKLIAAGGQDLVGKFTPEIQQLAQRYGELVRQQEELQRMQETLRTIGDIGKDALKGFVSDLRAGKSAGEALQNVLDRVVDKLLDLAINDMFKGFGGSGGGGFWGSMFKFIGSGFSSGSPGGSLTSGAAAATTGAGTWANGGVFGPGGLHAFALGGAFTNSVVNRPTLFPFANGTGLMGEAGPEAIMPLRRGRDGRLGVSAAVAAAQPAAEPARVSFSLINNGRPVEIESTQETPDGRGGRRVDVVLKESVGKAISEPGAARDAMQNTYGAKQRVARR